MLPKLTKSITISRATLRLNVSRVHTGCDGTHVIVRCGIVSMTQENSWDCPSSGLPDVCRVCVTFVMFHSVHKHVVEMMIMEMT